MTVLQLWESILVIILCTYLSILFLEKIAFSAHPASHSPLSPDEPSDEHRKEVSPMARVYSPATQKTVKEAVHKFKRGTLKSGRSKKPVRSRKQAIAIGLSEARAKGNKAPPKQKRTSRTRAKKTSDSA